MVESFELARLLASLEAEAAEGSSLVTEPLPASLPLTTITTLPEVFQVRAMDPSHVDDMARALRDGSQMPPLLVLRVGRKVIVVDGHHRLEAFHRAGFAEVPVVEFEGTVTAAALEACAANSITKLPMARCERQNAAWRYVRLGQHSKAQIAKAANCSTGTVANMRRVLGRLGAAADHVETWAEAMALDRMESRKDQTEEERAQWMESVAQDYANTLARTFADKLTKNPEIAARAIATHFGRRLEDLVMCLEEYRPDRGDAEY
ncbi:MAG: ParB N-terminal domain-containing protein [Aquamicrobium sp.]|nr:ParB N-terminal domain-containing protein [Aquamicrobium sp.]